MSHIPDEKLFSFADRVKGKAVIITGAANGIGKETALRFASYGARVVIADLDMKSAAKVLAEIKKAGGTGICVECNVTDFDDQVDMFELVMKKYGSVDIVVANAGVSELGTFSQVASKDGRPVKPTMKTLEVNLFGLLYTTHLATHYLTLNQKEGDLKSIIMIGSMASWQAIPMGELYSGSKHAVLGVMRSLHPLLEGKDIRVGCIHPFFADTAIVPVIAKLVLAGIPLTPVSRVAGAIFFAATDTDIASNGASWLLTDDGPVFMVPKPEFKEGVYRMIDERANKGKAAISSIKAWGNILTDVWRITGNAIMVAGLSAGLTKLAWDNRVSIESYIRSTLLS